MEGGNTLRKLLYIGILVIVMFFSTAEARANTVDDSFEKATSVEEAGVMDLDIIKITAGITKKHEVTFDKFRNISGEAEEGMLITFIVYQDDLEDASKLYTQVVGTSRLFSQLIELKEGNNYIIIIAQQEDDKKAFKFRIDCKDNAIKKKLEDIKIDNILTDTGVSQRSSLEILVK